MGIFGRFDSTATGLVFYGEPPLVPDPNNPQVTETRGLGVFVNDSSFSGGRISATVSFDSVLPNDACELILYWDPARQVRVSAGIGPPHMFAIRTWDGTQYNLLSFAGDRRNLIPGREYALSAQVQGSVVTLSVDGVTALSATLPFSVPETQTGIFCLAQSKVTVSSFSVDSQRGSVFVVMQLSPPYREIYEDVVKQICEKTYDVRNAEEMYGPGMIMADVTNDILTAEFLVADITPANPNVYYEVGYADAIGKPVILIADSAQLTKIPFDISPSRVIFYENTIAGKRKFEVNFARSIAALEKRRAHPIGAQGVLNLSQR